DFGFMLAIFAVIATFGTAQYTDVVTKAAGYPVEALGHWGLMSWIALGLMIGACGKSAQFPLHVWLPDAMAGPTPVSALIHAATMVAAGVFVVARLYPVFLATPAALAVLGVVAAVTMLGAALAALAQDDIKRVLAWSTVSQLAYMVGALACGSRDAAIYHLLVHAAFKALGFLAAGAIIHEVGSNLMSRMGGLGRLMPVTCVTLTVGLASGAGVVPLAGFFSKESVVGAADRAEHGDVASTAACVGWVVLLSALATVVVTAAYSLRLLLRTFAGEYRGAGHPHDAPALMTWPLVVLAVPAALLGVVGLSTSWLPAWLGAGAAGAERLAPARAPPVWSLALVALGGLAVWTVWRRDPTAAPATALGWAEP